MKILTENFWKLNKKNQQLCLEFYGLQFGHILKAIRPIYKIDQLAKSIVKKHCKMFWSFFDEEFTAKISADLKQVKGPFIGLYKVDRRVS